MKKLLLTTAIALSALTISKAQELKFGVKGGLALSIFNVSSGNENETNAKTSFYAGGLVEYLLSPKLALQGELIYADLGSSKDEKLSFWGNTLETKENINLRTLLIPLSAKYYVIPNFAVNGGLDFGFIVSKNIKYKSILNDKTLEDSSSNANKVFTSFYFAPFVGAEYNLNNGLFFDARYNLNANNLSTIDTKTSHAHFIQLGLGYKFN